MPLSCAQKSEKARKFGQNGQNRLKINESAQIWAWKNLISD